MSHKDRHLKKGSRCITAVGSHLQTKETNEEKEETEMSETMGRPEKATYISNLPVLVPAQGTLWSNCCFLSSDVQKVTYRILGEIPLHSS